MIILRAFFLLLRAICFFHILISLPSILTSGLISLGRTIIGAPASATEYSHALRTEFAGLEQLVQDTALLSPLSHDLVIGYIAIEDLLKVVRSSYLNGGDVLVEHLEALREDAKSTAYDLQALQVKVDGVIDR